MKKESPCHGCTDRWVIADRNCHSTCKRWSEWKAELDAENKARLAAEKARADATSFAVDSVVRTRRKQSCYKKGV